MREEEREHSPFRDLIETWLLQEMIFHHEEAGMVLRKLVTLDDFTTKTAKSIYRAAVMGDGDTTKTIRHIVRDYPDRVQRTFWARLAIMKKTWKDNAREDWLADIDTDQILGVLRRNDDGEIIWFCVSSGLYPGEQNGHPGEVRGVCP